MTTARAQLLVYAFGPDAAFEGGLTGALERIESGGTLRILEAFFVQSEAATGELVAIDVRGRGAGGFVGPLLEFRLDPAARRRATRRALDTEGDGLSEETLRRLRQSLPPGAALAALLVEHVWMGAVEDAMARTGGRPLADEFVDARGLADIGPALLDAAARQGFVAGGHGQG
jgi:hypothetical protein